MVNMLAYYYILAYTPCEMQHNQSHKSSMSQSWLSLLPTSEATALVIR